jgi:hypothetical protein
MAALPGSEIRKAAPKPPARNAAAARPAGVRSKRSAWRRNATNATAKIPLVITEAMSAEPKMPAVG